LRSALAAAAAAAALIAPAAAQAVTHVEVPKPCYAEGDSIGVNGTGFTPDGDVRVRLERAGEVLEESTDPKAAADGTVSGGYKVAQETGWFGATQTRFEMTLRLTDLARLQTGTPEDSADVTATTSFLFSRWNVGIGAVGGKIHPARPLRIHAVGYTNAVGKPLYAHWLLGSKRVFTKRLGKLRGPCGDLRTRLSRGFPFRPVKPGAYKVTFTSSRKNPRAKDAIAHTTARVKRRLG
jgi:hypothetical protein